MIFIWRHPLFLSITFFPSLHHFQHQSHRTKLITWLSRTLKKKNTPKIKQKSKRISTRAVIQFPTSSRVRKFWFWKKNWKSNLIPLISIPTKIQRTLSWSFSAKPLSYNYILGQRVIRDEVKLFLHFFPLFIYFLPSFPVLICSKIRAPCSGIWSILCSRFYYFLLLVIFRGVLFLELENNRRVFFGIVIN